MNLIKVKAAGMFTPQEEGDCKLTIIIPKDAKHEQDIAFTKLRYQDVVIGLASEQEQKDLTPLETAMQYVSPFIRAIDEVMAPYGLTVVLMSPDANRELAELSLKGITVTAPDCEGCPKKNELEDKVQETLLTAAEAEGEKDATG